MTLRWLMVVACLGLMVPVAQAETPEDIDAACATPLQRDEVIRTFFEALPTAIGSGHLDAGAIGHLSAAVSAVYVAGRSEPTGTVICRGIEVLRRAYGLAPGPTVIAADAPQPVAAVLRGCENKDTAISTAVDTTADMERITRSGALSDIEFGAHAVYLTRIKARIGEMDINARSFCLSMTGPWALYRR